MLIEEWRGLLGLNEVYRFETIYSVLRGDHGGVQGGLRVSQSVSQAVS